MLDWVLPYLATKYRRTKNKFWLIYDGGNRFVKICTPNILSGRFISTWVHRLMIYNHLYPGDLNWYRYILKDMGTIKAGNTICYLYCIAHAYYSFNDTKPKQTPILPDNNVYKLMNYWRIPIATNEEEKDEPEPGDMYHTKIIACFENNLKAKLNGNKMRKFGYRSDPNLDSFDDYQINAFGSCYPFEGMYFDNDYYQTYLFVRNNDAPTY